jgi:hypothetical protein
LWTRGALGEDRLRADVAGGRIEVRREAAGAGPPDAVVETSVATLRSLVFAGRPLAEALEAGDLRVSGDGEAVARFLRLFPRPTGAGLGADN